MNKNIDITTVGGRIKKARLDKGITQQALADQLYIPMTTLSTYENNKAELKGQVVVEIASALGTTTDYILKGVETETGALEEELLSVFNSLGSDELKKLAIAQMKCLAGINA